MGFSHSKSLHVSSLALAFLILAPAPRVVQPALAPPQPPLEPLNTLYQILDSMVKVMEGERSKVPLKPFLKIRNSIYQLDPGLATSQEKGWVKQHLNVKSNMS